MEEGEKKIVMRIVDRSLSVGNSSLMNSRGGGTRCIIMCPRVWFIDQTWAKYDLDCVCSRPTTNRENIPMFLESRRSTLVRDLEKDLGWCSVDVLINCLASLILKFIHHGGKLYANALMRYAYIRGIWGESFHIDCIFGIMSS